MKRKVTLLTAFCGFLFLVLSAYSDGPAKHANIDATARITVNCYRAGCHSSHVPPLTAEIQIRSKVGGLGSPEVTDFKPGEKYIVTFTTTSTHPKFGFQLAAIVDSPSGKVSAGKFVNLPVNTHITPVDGIDIVEHSVPLTKDAAGKYVVNVDWTAPASGTESKVVFVGVINAVDGDGTGKGDSPSLMAVNLLSNTASVKALADNGSILAYPNPTSDFVVLLMANMIPDNYDLEVYDATGSRVYMQQLVVKSANEKVIINMSEQVTGLYFARLSSKNSSKTISLIKQ